MAEEINVKELIEENMALKIENEKLKEVIYDVGQKLSNLIVNPATRRDLYGHMS